MEAAAENCEGIAVAENGEQAAAAERGKETVGIGVETAPAAGAAVEDDVSDSAVQWNSWIGWKSPLVHPVSSVEDHYLHQPSFSS